MTKKTERAVMSHLRSQTARSIKRFYECGICDCIHPWDFDGDCRDDSNRFSLDEMPADAELLSMDDRVNADRA